MNELQAQETLEKLQERFAEVCAEREMLRDALDRLYRWSAVFSTGTSYSGDHPMAIAREALEIPQ